MKNKFFLFLFTILLLLNISILPDSCLPCDSSSNNCESKSKTFFRPRAIVDDVVLYFAQNNYNNYKKYFGYDECFEDEPTRIHLYRGGFYQQSFNNKELAEYFLPRNQRSISIREDGTGDVGSLWLGVIAPDNELYESDLTLCPTRNVMGSFITYRQNFECLSRLWLDLRLAIYFAEHELRPRETLGEDKVEGTLNNAHTALQALDNPSQMHYGRISACKLKSANFDDIDLRIGYEVLSCEDKGYHLDLYGSMLIPISQQPHAHFLFEPLVGRGHFGLGVGLNGGKRLLNKPYKSLALMGDFSYVYQFSREELRSFDLKNNGEWSRYLRLVNRSTPAVSSPAINFTTKCVDVTPRGTINLWTALHYQHCSWHFEVGYNLWWRQAEKICLPKSGCLDPADSLTNLGIFDLANACNPTSASTANISESITVSGTGTNDVVSDPTFVALSIDDLDLASASHPSALTNKFYGAISYDTTFNCRPVNIALAGAVEFSRDRNAIEQWGVFANLNINF